MKPMPKIRQLTAAEIPAPLREIPEPPKNLWLQGDWPGEKYVYLTVVGSRRFSTYGRETTEKIISELAGQPIVIVSGLAIGIDTIAHKTAIKNGLKTVAVPGSGLDSSVLHPPSNRRLAEEIITAGGALLSELEPRAPAGIHTFPRRNRLMAGLAKGTLVIEANEKSGTLITARLATEYNREVLAVPGSIFSPNSRGTNQLIRQGATPVTSGDDVLLALGLELADSQQKLNWAEISPEEKKILGLLAVESLARDEIIRTLNFEPSQANALLMKMEIKGLIKESVGEFHINI